MKAEDRRVNSTGKSPYDTVRNRLSGNVFKQVYLVGLGLTGGVYKNLGAKVAANIQFEQCLSAHAPGINTC
jgi:hypothetical protein